MTEPKQRTKQQNKALHKYFTILAEELNAAGLDMRKVLKPEVEIPWTTQSVKNCLWRPLMQIMVDQISTTDMETKDITLIYETLNRHLSTKFGISTYFPSVEELMLEAEIKRNSS